jgi:hypothetical protein
MRWSLLGSAAIVLVAAGLVVPAMKRSNCGGNSAALAACKAYITVLQLWSADHEGQSFHFDQADTAARQELGRLPGALWIRSARLLARLDDVRMDAAADKRIIMVCDHPYGNVPQRTFGKSPMAHAVAYSTGETGLISPEQFARLDLSGFVDLQSLAVTGKVEPAGAANGTQPIRRDTNRTSSTAGSRR